MSETELKKATIKIADINDLKLEPEPLDIDPSGDAFQTPPPAPKGTYNFKAKLGTNGFEVGQTKQQKRYIMAHVELRFIAPGQRFDGHPVFDRASTLVQESTRTTRISGIMSQAGVVVPPKVNDIDLAKAFGRFLSGEPTVRAEIDWRGYCATCEKATLTGMDRFPALTNKETGQEIGRNHVGRCKGCGGKVVAQLNVERYVALQQG